MSGSQWNWDPFPPKSRRSRSRPQKQCFQTETLKISQTVTTSTAEPIHNFLGPLKMIADLRRRSRWSTNNWSFGKIDISVSSDDSEDMSGRQMTSTPQTNTKTNKQLLAITPGGHTSAHQSVTKPLMPLTNVMNSMTPQMKAKEKSFKEKTPINQTMDTSLRKTSINQSMARSARKTPINQSMATSFARKSFLPEQMERTVLEGTPYGSPYTPRTVIKKRRQSKVDRTLGLGSTLFGDNTSMHRSFKSTTTQTNDSLRQMNDLSNQTFDVPKDEDIDSVVQQKDYELKDTSINGNIVTEEDDLVFTNHSDDDKDSEESEYSEQEVEEEIEEEVEEDSEEEVEDVEEEVEDVEEEVVDVEEEVVDVEEEVVDVEEEVEDISEGEEEVEEEQDVANNSEMSLKSRTIDTSNQMNELSNQTFDVPKDKDVDSVVQNGCELKNTSIEDNVTDYDLPIPNHSDEDKDSEKSECSKEDVEEVEEDVEEEVEEDVEEEVEEDVEEEVEEDVEEEVEEDVEEEVEEDVEEEVESDISEEEVEDIDSIVHQSERELMNTSIGVNIVANDCLPFPNPSDEDKEVEDRRKMSVMTRTIDLTKQMNKSFDDSIGVQNNDYETDDIDVNISQLIDSIEDDNNEEPKETSIDENIGSNVTDTQSTANEDSVHLEEESEHENQNQMIGSSEANSSAEERLQDVSNSCAQHSPQLQGLRRSKRNRLPTLEYWRGQRPIYKRSKSGITEEFVTISDGFQSIKKVHKKSGNGNKRKKNINVFDLSLHKKVKTNNEKNDLIKTLDDLVWKESDNSAGVEIAITNKNRVKGDALGMLRLQSLAQKNKSKTGQYVTHMTVIYGALSLQIIDSREDVVKTGMSFTINANVNYSLKNLRKDIAVLSFTVLKE